jgi:hypothetical protein
MDNLQMDTSPLTLDNTPLNPVYPTADECMVAYRLWIADSQRADSVVSFSLFMSAKLSELWNRVVIALGPLHTP